MTERYVIDPLSPFPRSWQCAGGQQLKVMAGPVKGWLMVRTPGDPPWCISVSELLNATPHKAGPFKLERRG